MVGLVGCVLGPNDDVLDLIVFGKDCAENKLQARHTETKGQCFI
jgi:hypothetical protein